MKKTHRLILVGHGGISKSYVKAFSKLANAEIVGVVGRNMDRVKEFADSYSISDYGISIEAVAKKTNATAAIICTPNALHYDGVIEASQIGLHCLCEKPLDISPEKQELMIESCQKHQVKLAVSYMRRFINHFHFIKELIDSSKLGRVMVVDVMIKHFRDQEYYHSWHGTSKIDGGGPFIQQGSHIIDLALWLCNGYSEVIEAKRFQVYHDIEVEDHGYAVIKYSNGAIGMIEASTASFGLKNEAIEISGTKGSIAANYNGITTFAVPGVDVQTFLKEQSTNEALFEQLALDFIDSIENDRSPFVDGQSATTTTKLVTDIYKKAGDPIQTFSD